ncbi:sigma-70 family RNA polymerase sigma factor [Pedobacter alpinus]|uniref:Sigma-70 family RNA polymerase sigma factor n=1 Tax=Pedobacter alpinus TaxID=1590643 RepID=A0ABW5TSW3_9SPHI
MQESYESETAVSDWDLVYFESLYKELSISLQNYADYFLQDSELAFTVVNDLFVNLWFSPTKPDNLKAYLYKSVKNQSLNHLKKNKKNFLSYLNQPDLNQVAELIAEPIGHDEESDQLVFLQQIINMLPKKRQLVFKMYRLEGFSYAEIADLLQISTRTVEDHLMKSMQFIHAKAKHLVDK